MQSTKIKKKSLTYQKTKSPKSSLSRASNRISCQAKSTLAKGIRRLKVYYKVGFGNDVPVILLQGEWIKSLGFNVQDRIVVSGELGRLEVRLEE